MAYTAKKYDNLLGMEGFSDTILQNHFKLYEGYVTNTNKVIDILGGMVKDDKLGTPEFAEIKRRLGWEFNGMRLHELYFGNLRGDGKIDEGGKLAKDIVRDFGSLEACLKDFQGTGKLRGIGWVILYQDDESGRLLNYWINEHDVGHPSGCTPLLVMDVFEHAFITDYGLARAGYIGAFFKNIDWGVVSGRQK